MEWLKCEQCHFWSIVDFDNNGQEIWDCTVSSVEEADMIPEEMWCQHMHDDKENLED